MGRKGRNYRIVVEIEDEVEGLVEDEYGIHCVRKDDRLPQEDA